MIFYEAPHKLLRTLADLLEAFGDRDVALCRELTKLHEEVLRTTLSGALEHFSAPENPPRGEFVLVLRGASPPEAPAMDAASALALVERLREAGNSLREACRLAAAESGMAKNELYALAVKEKHRT